MVHAMPAVYGLLDDAQKRVMYAVEMRNLERLVLRADMMNFIR